LIDQVSKYILDANDTGSSMKYPGSLREICWFYSVYIENTKPVFPARPLNRGPWSVYFDQYSLTFEVINESNGLTSHDKGFLYESLSNFALLSFVVDLPVSIGNVLVEYVSRDFMFMKQRKLTGNWLKRGNVSDTIDDGEYRAIFDYASIDLQLYAFPSSDDVYDMYNYDSEKGYDITRKYLLSYYTPDRPYVMRDGDTETSQLIS
jgi:hypothetical protein